MATSVDVQRAVSQRLESFLHEVSESEAGTTRRADILIDAAQRACAGGKRLRALFCYTGWTAVNQHPNDDAIIDIAAALELFQAAALVHDDIIDNSDTRRGEPAAHRALETLHRSKRWRSRSEEFGRSAAVLLGDLLVALSDDLFEHGLALLDSPAAARHEYALMRREVTIGQFLDIAQESAWATDPIEEHVEAAREVASMKSARYSVQQPLVIGAAAAGGNASQLESLRAFGHPIGMAFQLRDDELGVFGDPSVTGKPAGDDLREGKRTVLIAYTREALAPQDRDYLDERLGHRDLDDADVQQLQSLIRSTGALERMEADIDAFAHRADQALNDASFTEAATLQLRALAARAVQRKA